jgi:hypothetical protein
VRCFSCEKDIFCSVYGGALIHVDKSMEYLYTQIEDRAKHGTKGIFIMIVTRGESVVIYVMKICNDVGE